MLGFNMYAYCCNNPVNMVDYSGERYCAGTTVQNEQWYERKDSLKFQQYVSKSKNNPKPVNKYSNGDVYIVENKSDVKATWGSNVVVIDCKGTENYQVVDSFKITKTSEQNEIVDIIISYDNVFSDVSKWKRTKESMIIEWDAHNFLTFVFDYVGSKHHYDRAKSVDFDNPDEGKSFLDHTLGKFLNEIGRFFSELF